MCIERSPATQEPLEKVDVSKNLRLLMAQRNLTVMELAKLAGVSKSAMEKYLAGPSSPKATAIASIARALEVDAGYILFGKFDMDREAILSAAQGVVSNLLEELHGASEIGKQFRELSPGSQEANHSLWGLAFEKAREIRNRAFVQKRAWLKDDATISYL